MASAIAGVHKPKLFRSHRWQDDGRCVVWRADETELVKSAAVNGSGVITSVPVLDERWWSDLSASLAALSAHDEPGRDGAEPPDEAN